MGSASYLVVMLGIVLGSAWLEVGLRTRVLRRWRRLLLTIIPVVAVFALWDVYAIAQGHWWFDESMITGWRLPGDLPVDELVFFIVVPIASVLTLEAVRSATGLPVGDEVEPIDHGAGEHEPGEHEPGEHQPGEHQPGDLRTSDYLAGDHEAGTPREQT